MSITKNLPAWCYCTSPRTGDVVIVTRGEKAMYQTKSEVVVSTANRQLGVGDEVDGDEVRDGGRHGVGSAHGGGAVLQLGADGALFDHGQVLLSDLRALRPAVFGC